MQRFTAPSANGLLLAALCLAYAAPGLAEDDYGFVVFQRNDGQLLASDAASTYPIFQSATVTPATMYWMHGTKLTNPDIATVRFSQQTGTIRKYLTLNKADNDIYLYPEPNYTDSHQYVNNFSWFSNPSDYALCPTAYISIGGRTGLTCRFTDAELASRGAANPSTSITAYLHRISLGYGGAGGTDFTFLGTRNGYSTAFHLRAGAALDAIGITDGAAQKRMAGGTGGTEATLSLQTGEFVLEAEVCTGAFTSIPALVRYVRLTTNGGRTLVGGEKTSSCTTVRPPTNYRINGVYGRSGTLVDLLGFTFKRNP